MDVENDAGTASQGGERYHSMSLGQAFMKTLLTWHSIFGIKQTEIKFKFFPQLYWIFATCPNVTEIVTTTGLCPTGGHSTTWFQLPDDSQIDPLLHDPNPLPIPPTPAQTFRDDVSAILNATTTPVMNPGHTESLKKSQQNNPLLKPC
ncbi:hypothetical protein BDZ94DRAFT_1309197 [Collybia nuda]|uniref:Uncharacterized protein n=1 Tax=Collybia nuda TaxID=64659 RepID=A0A9P6CJJ2_9AGAR|nr:hypothetical protein BDZ94DRAFT_1309197 [Collybia nuda]